MNEGSKLEEIIYSVLHLVEGDNVLDVGTGYGTVITKLLQRPKVRVTSVDPEAWTFEQIQKEFASRIAEGNLRLLKAGAERLPFGDGVFETSIAVCSLHHLQSPSTGMREIERVASRRVIVTDWQPSSSGIHNPHSPKDLEKNRDEILEFAYERGYNFEDHDKWFLVWR